MARAVPFDAKASCKLSGGGGPPSPCASSTLCPSLTLRAQNDVNDDFQGFTVENDCLTPTFKLRRPQLLERYREAIDEIYIKRDGSATKG